MRSSLSLPTAGSAPARRGLLLGTLVIAALGASCATDEAPARREAPPFPDIVVEEGDGAPGADEDASPPRAPRPAPDDGPAPSPRSSTESDRQPRSRSAEPRDEGPVLRERVATLDDEAGSAASRARRPAPPPKELRGPVPPERRMRVHALDVGQGSATLIELPCAAILVDTGGEENEAFDGPAALLEELDRFFRRRPDLDETLALLVITHPHIDHVRAVPDLLARYRVLGVVDNGSDGEELVAKPMAALRKYVKEHGVPYRAVSTKMTGAQGLSGPVIDPVACRQVDPVITALAGHAPKDPGWGEDFYGNQRYDDENNHSVGLRVDFGASSLLLTGDLEEVAIEALIERTDGTGALDADIYVVGHHGSHNGTTRELLEEVTPDLALISMGPADRKLDWTAWRYGHPRAGIVKLLADMVRGTRDPVTVPVARYGRRFDPFRMEKAVYATGWDGTVVVEASAEGGLRVVDRASLSRPRTAAGGR